MKSPRLTAAALPSRAGVVRFGAALLAVLALASHGGAQSPQPAASAPAQPAPAQPAPAQPAPAQPAPAQPAPAQAAPSAAPAAAVPRAGGYPSAWDTVTVMTRLGEQLGREAFPALLVVEGGYACLPGARGASAECAARRRAAIVSGTYVSPRIVQLAAAAPAAIVIDGESGAWSARFFQAQGGDPCTGTCAKTQRVVRRVVLQGAPRFARDTALVDVAEYVLRPGYPEQVVPEIARYVFLRSFGRDGWEWRFARRVIAIAE